MATDLKNKAKKLLTPALVFHTVITAVKARGIYVEASDGKTYMDFTSGLATANIGHSHPSVVRAAAGQAKKLIHSGCIFHYASEVELAQRLERVTPPNIEMFFFSNSGAEAVEGAIKLSRYHTGRQAIIAFSGGFHGRTYGALSLTSSAARYRKGYHPLLPSVYHAPYPYCYRCPMGMKRESCSIECFAYLERMLRCQVTPEETACVVIEPVLGEGGYVPPPADFMKMLRALCTEHGIMLVADEVQTGFGRTGRWFGVEHFGVEPDIITMAKGIASGFPLSALGASRKIMSAWAPGAHGTTFGGNPVSCSAACATIDTIEKNRLLDNARKVGAQAMKRLLSMKERFSRIGDVRGLGVMIGVEMVKEDSRPDREGTDEIIKRCLKNGLVIIECGIDKNIIRLMPPLTTKGHEMDRALDIFEEALVG